MADDMQRLIVSLEARTRAFENALNKANGTANRRARAIETRFARMNKQISGSFTALGGKMAAAFAVAGGLRGFQSLLDSATRIDNALKVAGLSGEELEKVYGRLSDSAIKSAAPLEALVELYGRAALVQKELGITGEELLGFTDKIAVALRVSGQSAAESSGALLQLSQALGSGTVRAEEFNSILEGALPIAQAAAVGLKEAGGSVSKLRQLVVDGKISSEAFFRAFEAGAPMLEEKVKDAELTTSQAMENIQTALINAAREFAKGSLAVEGVAEAFQMAADWINGIDFEEFGAEVRKLIGWIGEIKAALDFVGNLGANIGEATGLNQLGEALTGGAIQRKLGPLSIQSDTALQKRLGGAVEQPAGSALTPEMIKRFAGEVVNQSGKAGRIEKTAEIVPVSLGDFAAPSGKKKGGAGGKSPQEKYGREVEQIKERTAALLAETAAMAGLNPLVDDYGYAMEKVRAEQDLLAAAQKAGLTITPELSASISQLAEGYAQASVEAQKLAESQDAARESAEDFKQTGKDVMSGFISDLRSGKSASEALANALNKVADKLIDVALNSAFGIGKPSGGGGLFGGLLGGIGKLFGFADGGYTGNGGKNEAAGIVHKGEYVMDAATTKRIGVRNLRRLQGYAQGGLVGSAPTLPSMAPQQPAQGGHITVTAVSEVQNGNLVPTMTVVAGQVAGRQIKQVNRNLQGRLQTVQTRGV